MRSFCSPEVARSGYGVSGRATRTGVSLAEVILTSFIVFMLLATVATLVRQYREVLTHTRLKDASLRSALGLQQAANEAREAIELITPPPGVGGAFPSLELTRIDPNSPSRFPSPLPAPPPPPYDPRVPLIGVRYTVDAGELVRFVQVGTQVSRQLIAENVLGFTAENQGATSVKLTLRVREDKMQRVYEVLSVVRQ
ncbi:MAG: hypothetical protein AMXMBFR33_23150 [Candidatus Xenobia bacterium]